MMNTNGINNLPLSLVQQTSAVQKPATEANAALTTDQAAITSGTHTNSDQASLSPASTLLAQALTTSDVRTEKVASLQQAIASGSYHVSSADVANKLVESLLG